MPIYAYRCACGKTADVLVRASEPTCCDDAREFAGACGQAGGAAGTLTRLLSAPYVGRSNGGGGRSAAPAEAECGACGMAPGSGGES